MFTKTMITVSVAVVLGTASAALAGSDRDEGGGYQVQNWQGIQRLNHPSYMTDAGRAYALDESSKQKKPKKGSKQAAPSTTGQVSKPAAPSTKCTGPASRAGEC